MNITFGWHAVQLKHEQHSSAVFYALHTNEHGSAVIGSCRLDPWGLSKRPFISALCIDPDYRGKGIGTGLFQFILQASRERSIESLALWVRKENVDAQRFYSRIGFKPFFEDGDNLFFGLTVSAGGAA